MPARPAERIEANLAALEVLRELGESPATPAQQEILARWSSWGAASHVFDEHRAEFAPARDRLKDLLDESAYAAARRTTVNAHYTDPRLVAQMWHLLHGLEVPDDALILEPGCGAGAFIGQAPARTRMVGVELDPTTAAIAKKLHPGAEIRAESFAQTVGVVADATIGNVPFADVHLFDPVYNPRRRHSMHNHFVIKSLGLTSPGGIVAVLSSRFTLDAADDISRREIHQQAELVTAIRLPARTHERTAGTAVVTDLLVFRRRTQPPAADEPLPAWVQTSDTTINNTTVRLNRWFQEHPDHVLGTLATEHTPYGTDDLTVRMDGDLDHTIDQLAAVIDSDIDHAHTAGLTFARSTEQPPEPSRPATMIGHVQPAADGGFEVITPDGTQPLRLGRGSGPKDRNQHAEMRALLHLRDCHARVLELDTTTVTDGPENIAARAALRRAVEGYHATWGPINRFSVIRKQLNPATSLDDDTVDRLTADGSQLTQADDGTRWSERRQLQSVALRALRVDPAYVNVIALEKFDDTEQTATLADICLQRTVSARVVPTHADTPADAVAMCMDALGHLDATYLAGLLDLDESAVDTALGDLAYRDPADGSLLTAGAYLSGPVRARLKTAREAAAADPAYQRNVDALTRVVPPDLQPGEIRAALGASWIPDSDIRQFVTDVLQDSSVTIEHQLDKWHVSGGNKWSVLATETWGTERMPASRILGEILNHGTFTVYDPDPADDKKRIPNLAESEAARAKADALSDRFDEWAWENPERANRLATRYNDLFNGTVARTSYAYEHMQFPGMSANFTPAPHQVNALARAIAEPSVGLFHAVGLGKTAVMAMTMTELKRLGAVNKPAMIVPNHMLEQALREFLQIYPAARILAADNVGATQDQRRTFVAQAANGNWDAVIMTHAAFVQLRLTEETVDDYITSTMGDHRAALEAARGEQPAKTTKQIEREVMRIEERVKAQLAVPRDAGIAFEQTGIDYLCIDELHEFKNLTTLSSIQGAGIAGSNKASNVHAKIDYLRRTNPRGRAVLGATATPLSNSIAEVHVMLRYLAPELLRDAGVQHFDTWASTFAQVITSTEVKPAGTGFRQVQRLAKFQNVPELLTMWKSVSDTVNASEASLAARPQLSARPEDGERAPEIVTIPASSALADFIGDLAHRAEHMPSDPHLDNMLKVTSEGRHAALDLRLTPRYAGTALADLDLDQPTKVAVAADHIATIWEQTKNNRYRDHDTGDPHPTPGALQIVFCDLGLPNPTRSYNVYDDLTQQLVQRGIPRERIGRTSDAETSEEKATLFRRARNGELNVIIGSTPRMGVGTNIQTRAVALHHLDCTWKPAEIEQREGRIVRQRNQNPEVRILRYVVENSFDGYMWQTVARKARFIDQVMHGSTDRREINDELASSETLSYAEIQAAATNNPYLREHQEATAELARLTRAERSHRQAQDALHARIRDSQQTIAQLEDVIPQRAALIAGLPPAGDTFTITIAGTTHHDRRTAGEALTARLQPDEFSVPHIWEPRPVLTLRGIDFTVNSTFASRYDGQVVFRAPLVGQFNVTAADWARARAGGQAAVGLISRFEHLIDQLPAAQHHDEARLTELHDDIQQAEQRLGPWKDAPLKIAAQQRVAAVEAAMAAEANRSDTTRIQAMDPATLTVDDAEWLARHAHEHGQTIGDLAGPYPALYAVISGSAPNPQRDAITTAYHGTYMRLAATTAAHHMNDLLGPHARAAWLTKPNYAIQLAANCYEYRQDADTMAKLRATAADPTTPPELQRLARVALNATTTPAQPVAVTRADGTREWLQYGELSRSDGPAKIDPDGTEHWYLYGHETTPDEQQRTAWEATKLNPPETTQPPARPRPDPNPSPTRNTTSPTW